MGGLVGGMVTIGGITRLTKSGLSMTDWSIQVGTLPNVPPIIYNNIAVGWITSNERCGVAGGV